MNSFRKIQFRCNYRIVKSQIKSCEDLIRRFRKERDIYHANIWEEKLSKAKQTLKTYEFFISLFPEVMK